MPDPVPSPDFPFLEFLLMEIVNQSQIDFFSISDTLDLRETSNSLRKASRSTDLPLKSVQNRASDEEIREIRDFASPVHSFQKVLLKAEAFHSLVRLHKTSRNFILPSEDKELFD